MEVFQKSAWLPQSLASYGCKQKLCILRSRRQSLFNLLVWAGVQTHCQLQIG